MNLHLKRTISIISTILIIAVVFYLYLPAEESRIETMNTTVGENHVDILCVGSSHMYMGINPIQLYSDKGWAAYNIANSCQAPWQSLCYIKECCKTQKPKLIILDTYMIANNSDPQNYEDYQTVLNLLNLPLSVNKTEALLVSKADSKLNILLRFPYIYNDWENYSGFSLKKLYGKKNYSLGYSYTDAVEEYYDILDTNSISESIPLHQQNEKYLRKIIEYCQENGIEILLTNTPWPCITEETQKRFNSIQKIADEYNISFINGCNYYEEMGINYSTDSSGDRGHLNHSGVTKYTKWLEEYIEENYNDLTNHRNDDQYEAYELSRYWLRNKIQFH